MAEPGFPEDFWESTTSTVSEDESDDETTEDDDSTGTSEEEEEAADYMYEVDPYQFEPQCSSTPPADVDQDVQEREEEEQSDLGWDETRLSGVWWCTCGKCKVMEVPEACYCCQEKSRFTWLQKEAGDGTCLTDHDDFGAHINEEVLRTYQRTSKKLNWTKKQVHPMTKDAAAMGLRVITYRHVIDWAVNGEKLGTGNRFPVPACVGAAIREKFPSAETVGFKKAQLSI